MAVATQACAAQHELLVANCILWSRMKGFLCRWRKIEFPPHAHVPEPRGGFVFAVVGDVVLLHGGFAKVRDTHKRVQGKTFTVSPSS